MSNQPARAYRPEKEAIVAEIRRGVSESAFIFLTDFKGLTVSRAAELRRRLRPAKARYQVVPNRLFLQAVKDLPAAELKPALRGSTAMVTGAGDPVETAKILAAFAKETQMAAAKGGVMEGAMLSAADLGALALMPGKKVLQGQLVGTLAAPMRNLAAVLHQKVATLVYVLKAVEEKKAGTAPSA